MQDHRGRNEDVRIRWNKNVLCAQSDRGAPILAYEGHAMKTAKPASVKAAGRAGLPRVAEQVHEPSKKLLVYVSLSERMRVFKPPNREQLLGAANWEVRARR